uniref:Fibroblast growth factor 23 n=1 Tax=Oncorhynchus kisutch TaxID=8019 RepID=A0A8C7MAX6_ONCKI
MNMVNLFGAAALKVVPHQIEKANAVSPHVFGQLCLFHRNKAICFLTVVLPIRTETSDFVSILDLKSKRFLCVDDEEKWFSSMMFSRKECLFQHRRMENHVDVFYSSSNGLLLLLEGAEIPVKGYDLLKRHMVYRRKRSQQENPDADSMEDQDLAMQQDQERAGAISKETITSCDDPLRVLHSNSPGSPTKMAVQKADKVAQGGLAV